MTVGDMEKKKAALLIIGLIVAALGIAMLAHELRYRFLLSRGLHTTIAEINSNPQAWVSRKVVVEGKLEGPMASVWSYDPPCGCILYESSATADTIRKPGTAYIRLYWNSHEQYSLENVIAIGVVKEGYRQARISEGNVFYYIEVESICRSDFLLPISLN